MMHNGKPRHLGGASEGGINQSMTDKPIPMCGEHQVKKEWRLTTFEYSEGGITVRVPNIYAWVCPISGEASFPPGTVDELITTVRELIALAKRARERRQVLTEYIVSVRA